MAPPAVLRYANEQPPDQDLAYSPPASRRTLGRRPTARGRDQKPPSDSAVYSQEPDIEWIPSFKSYRDRCLRRIKTGGLAKTLPEGFPLKLESPLAWEGSKIKKEEYIVELSAQEITETEDALRDFKCKFLLDALFSIFSKLALYIFFLPLFGTFPCAGCMKAYLS